MAIVSKKQKVAIVTALSLTTLLLGLPTLMGQIGGGGVNQPYPTIQQPVTPGNCTKWITPTEVGDAGAGCGTGGGGSGITALTGDVAASGTGSVVATIQSGVVTGSKIASATITNSNIAANTITNGNIALAQITGNRFPNQLSNLIFAGPASGGSQSPSFRAMVGADLPSPFTSGTISGNTSKFVTTTGTLTNSHCVQIDNNGNFIDAGASCGTSSGGITALTGDVAATGPGSVTATIQAGAVTGSKIAANTITGNNIASNTVTGSNIANDTITGANFPNQNANTVFAGPVSGGSNTPSWRGLVAADLPTAAITGSNFPVQNIHTFFSGPSSGSAATPTWRLMVASDLPSPFTSGTASGNTSTFATTTGTLTSGHCVDIDANGNFIDAGSACGGGGGSPGGSSGQVQYNNAGAFGGLTTTQLTADINTFTSTLSGAVPASGGGTTNFLRADGTFSPPGGGTGVGTNLYWINIKTYGATGDGTCHQLSSVYGSVAAAQAVYPFVSDLTQCIDWAATQQAINVAMTTGATANDSATVYCPEGRYVIENPIFLDTAHNTQGNAPAWVAGTTYPMGTSSGFGTLLPQVTYNGVPYASLGSGNVGNPPTSSVIYPGFPTYAQLTGSFNQASFSEVQISNGSPAVITLPSFTTSFVSANEAITFSTMKYAVPGGSAPALPTGINPNQVYYIRDISGNTFHVATTPGGTAVNTSSAGVGVFFVNSQVWVVSPQIPSSNFSGRISFVGDSTAGNSGCQFKTHYMMRNAAFYIGPQNSNIIQGIGVTGPDGGIYRCNMDPGNAGFVVMANGGGAHNTNFRDSGTAFFYSGITIGFGNGQLGDTNNFTNVGAYGGCIGIQVISTQAFIDIIRDSNINNNTTGLINSNSEGFKVHNGNYSTNTSITNQFTISGVSTSSGYPFSGSYIQVNATITNADAYLQNPYCSYNAGYYINNSNSLNGGVDNPYTYQCGYNLFTIVTAHNGVIPLYISSFNPFTGAATFQMPAYWGWIYAGYNCCTQLEADIAAATTLYAAEATTTFFGQIVVDTNHIENDGVPTQLICACGGFANGRQAELHNIILNSAISLGDGVAAGITPATGGGYASWWTNFYAQQTLPYLNASGTGLILDNSLLGASNQGFLAHDRNLIALSAGFLLEGRNNSNTAGTLFFDFMSSNQNDTVPIGAVSRNSRFASGLRGGTAGMSGGAIGGGLWDNPGWFLSAAAWHRDSDNLLGDFQQDYGDVADAWRAIGWGQAPTWGIRPVPWANACITSAQSTLLGSLPTIQHSSHLQGFPPITNGGTGYSTNDIVTMGTGGTYSTPAQVQVVAQTGGVVTAVKAVTGGVYSIEPTGTMTATSGGTGNGLVITPNGNNTGNWDVEYVITYPLLYGGQIYHVCDGIETAPAGGKWAWMAGGGQKAYSYWQSLTTTNVPNLKWTQTGDSPFIYMNGEALLLMFPGLVLNLTPDGGTCAASMEQFMVLEVHPTMGYVKVVRVDSDSGSTWVPGWASTGTTCTNTVIGQQSLTVVNPY